MFRAVQCRLWCFSPTYLQVVQAQRITMSCSQAVAHTPPKVTLTGGVRVAAGLRARWGFKQEAA